MNKTKTLYLILMIFLQGLFLLVCQQKMPELSGQLHGPFRVLPGTELRNSLQITLKNTGKRTAAPFSISLVLVNDSTELDQLVENAYQSATNQALEGSGQEISSIKAADSIRFVPSGKCQIPINTPPGNYFVGLIIDLHNQVLEINETNNIIFSPIKIIECQPMAQLQRLEIIDILEQANDFGRLHLAWEYSPGEPPFRLWVTIFIFIQNSWETITPQEKPFEIPNAASTTSFVIKVWAPRAHATYRIRFKAHYSCEREQDFTFKYAT